MDAATPAPKAPTCSQCSRVLFYGKSYYFMTNVCVHCSTMYYVGTTPNVQLDNLDKNAMRRAMRVLEDRMQMSFSVNPNEFDDF